MRSLFSYFVVCLVLSCNIAAADDLLIFSASWCGPCRALKQAIEKDPSLVDGFSVHLIDIDENPGSAATHGVKIVPTLVRVMENGKTVKKVGFTSSADLRQWLQKKN